MTVLSLLAGLAFSACGCSDTTEGFADDGRRAAPVRPAISAEDRRMYEDAARSAWAYLNANYQPATGFVNATPDWQYTTIWDIGAQLLAFHAAKELGFIPRDEFDRRMRRTLATAERLELFRGIAYNKTYSTRTGAAGTDSRQGATGWSATDLGRFLLALKVIAAREPQFAEQTERIARRIKFDDVVVGGYLRGQLIGNSGRPWSFQEGRIGYEQYAATGFSMWGANVRNALDLRRNAHPVRVLGVELPADKRWNDRLLSEPFILMEIEVGLPADMRQLATNVLAAQEARFRETGQVTIVSEDAVGVPPHYFYYYCVYCNRKPFVVDISIPGRELDAPRWVSTKGAFGWHAIMPSDYTRRAVQYVQRARSQRGWASGVYERTQRSTETYDVNTASVMLEIALYALRNGTPIIRQGAAATAATGGS